MPDRIPFDIEAEYRGERPGGEFTPSDSPGEVRQYAPALRFEVEEPNGDVGLLTFSQTVFDRVEPPIDAAKLVKGDTLRLAGVTVVMDRNRAGGSDRASYVQLQRAEVRQAAKLSA